jgi:hypothetical protein
MTSTNVQDDEVCALKRHELTGRVLVDHMGAVAEAAGARRRAGDDARHRADVPGLAFSVLDAETAPAVAAAASRPRTWPSACSSASNEAVSILVFGMTATAAAR